MFYPKLQICSMRKSFAEVSIRMTHFSTKMNKFGNVSEGAKLI